MEALQQLAPSNDVPRAESHSHAPWKAYNFSHGLKFDTAMEAEYPDQLCLKLAKLIFDLATRAGFDPNTFAPPAKLRERREAMAAAASRQPRGTRFPRLIPEYKR